MNAWLDHLNRLDERAAEAELLKACGSRAWAREVVAARPFATAAELHAVAERTWLSQPPASFFEAFAHHPRIGDLQTLRSKFTLAEQSGTKSASDETLHGLQRGNAEYEARFGHLFLVCATGKSADEMLALLRTRLGNEPAAELRIAAGEQAKITRLRLELLMAEPDATTSGDPLA